VTIPLAFARIATAFSAAGLGPYAPAVARWPGVPVTVGGSIVSPGTPIAKDCIVQIDVATQAMRSEAGFVDTDVAILILCTSVDAEMDTDATISASGGPRPGDYSVQSVAKDSMSTHWICRGRAT